MPSELQVNTITEATSGSGITFAKDVIPATPLSHRNMIINGAMQVAQRGTSHTGVSATGYHLDRFETTLQGLGAYTITQSTTAPTSEGFAQSYKIDCTTADASPAASDFFFISHKMEGQNLQQLCKGTSSAKSVTLSFWCRCTKTGNIQVNLYDWDNARIIGQAVSINSADTWEYKTLTFAGDTSGVLGNDNGASLVLEWWLDKGSNFSGGSVPTSWEALNNADRAVGCTLALGDNTANDFYLTGVQLELGSVATPFEHRTYGDELQRCQRYYQRLPDVSGSGANYASVGTGFVNSATQADIHIDFKTAMRTSPSFSITGFHLRGSGFASDVTSITSTYLGSNSGFAVVTASSGGMTTGNGVNLRRNNSSSHYIELDAEL